MPRRPSADPRDDEPEWVMIILTALVGLGVVLAVIAVIYLVYALVA